MSKTNEIDRILNTINVNPFAIFGLPTTSTKADALKAYRQISIKVHPDKFRGESKQKAQQAFSLLNNAKEQLTDDKKRADLLKQVGVAKSKLITILTTEERDRRKKKALAVGKTYDVESDPEPIPNFEEDAAEFEQKLMLVLREDLIEAAWIKSQELKDVSEHNLKQHKERELIKAAEQEKNEEKKRWEETSEQRSSNWKSFQSNKRKLFKAPGVKAEAGRVVKKLKADEFEE